jgi:hypothetical protein
MKYSNTEREQAFATLRENIQVGDTVYCILRSVSRSGMSRVISFVTIKDGDTRTWDYSIACVLGESLDKRKGVKVSGCGMDMGFATVYNLGRVLFPDGFGTEGKDAMGRTVRPKSRDAAARAVARGFVFRGRNGDKSGWDNDGGYALDHRWL